MATTYIVLPPSGGSGSSLYWEDPVADQAALPVTDNAGAVRLTLDTGDLYWFNGVSWDLLVSPTADVEGPASSTDEALVRFNGSTGKLIQNSNATLTDAGLLTLAVALPVASGGTNSTTALNNGRAMRSNSGAIVESGVTIDGSDNLATTARINAGTAKVGATGAAATSTTLEVAGTSGAFLLPRLTDAQRDALTPTEGMVVFNSTSQRPQCYIGNPTNSWVDMIGWGS